MGGYTIFNSLSSLLSMVLSQKRCSLISYLHGSSRIMSCVSVVDLHFVSVVLNVLIHDEMQCCSIESRDWSVICVLVLNSSITYSNLSRNCEGFVPKLTFTVFKFKLQCPIFLRSPRR